MFGRRYGMFSRYAVNDDIFFALAVEAAGYLADRAAQAKPGPRAFQNKGIRRKAE